MIMDPMLNSLAQTMITRQECTIGIMYLIQTGITSLSLRISKGCTDEPIMAHFPDVRNVQAGTVMATSLATE